MFCIAYMHGYVFLGLLAGRKWGIVFLLLCGRELTYAVYDVKLGDMKRLCLEVHVLKVCVMKIC